jgi:hypothetical protein
MHLVDTDVISEVQKQNKVDAGVRAFFLQAQRTMCRSASPPLPSVI